MYDPINTFFMIMNSPFLKPWLVDFRDANNMLTDIQDGIAMSVFIQKPWRM